MKDSKMILVDPTHRCSPIPTLINKKRELYRKKHRKEWWFTDDFLADVKKSMKIGKIKKEKESGMLKKSKVDGQGK